MAWLDRPWRVLATGLSFATFGLGGLLLWAFYFPWLRLTERDPAGRTSRARAMVSAAFRAFIRFMRSVGVLTFEIEGSERLRRRGLLILANHPTLIDVVFLVSLVPDAVCIVKPSVPRNPFMRGPATATAYLSNDDGAGLVDDCIAALERGENLIVFPEGTRTPIGGRGKMRRGAANIAVRGRRDITPVTISCVPIGLAKSQAWWQVPARPMCFRIRVRDDLAIAPFLTGAHGDARAARELTDYLEHYFAEHGDDGRVGRGTEDDPDRVAQSGGPPPG